MHRPWQEDRMTFLAPTGAMALSFLYLFVPKIPSE